MLRAAWKSLLGRKLRLLMSTFAIVLGVAFVAGSLIFTDALGGAFDGIIEGSTADVEVAYKGANNFDSVQDNRTIPGSVVDEIDALPDVEKAYGVKFTSSEVARLKSVGDLAELIEAKRGS